MGKSDNNLIKQLLSLVLKKDKKRKRKRNRKYLNQQYQYIPHENRGTVTTYNRVDGAVPFMNTSNNINDMENKAIAIRTQNQIMNIRDSLQNLNNENEKQIVFNQQITDTAKQILPIIYKKANKGFAVDDNIDVTTTPGSASFQIHSNNAIQAGLPGFVENVATGLGNSNNVVNEVIENVGGGGAIPATTTPAKESKEKTKQQVTRQGIRNATKQVLLQEYSKAYPQNAQQFTIVDSLTDVKKAFLSALKKDYKSSGGNDKDVSKSNDIGLLQSKIKDLKKPSKKIKSSDIII